MEMPKGQKWLTWVLLLTRVTARGIILLHQTETNNINVTDVTPELSDITVQPDDDTTQSNDITYESDVVTYQPPGITSDSNGVSREISEKTTQQSPPVIITNTTGINDGDKLNTTTIVSTESQNDAVTKEINRDNTTPPAVTRETTDDVNQTLQNVLSIDPVFGDANSTVTSTTKIVGLYVSYVTTPLFAVLGIFGNALTVAVMTHKAFSSMTMSIILTALSVSDTTFLLMQPFTKQWVTQLLGKDIRALDDASCKIFFVILKTAKMSSSWFVVLVCFERFVAVWFPLHARIINSRRNISVSLVVIVSTALVFNGFWSFASKVIDGVYCTVNYSQPDFATKTQIFSLAGILMYVGIPTILLAIMTPAIIFRLLHQAKMLQTLSSTTLRKRDHNQKTVAMLMSVTVAYILLASPIAMVFIVAVVQKQNLFQTKDPVISVMREVAQPLELLNYSINFFLYVAFSKTFRGRVAEIFGCKVSKKSLSTELSITRTTT